MTWILAWSAAVCLGVLVVVAVVAVVRRDGLGHRPPPADRRHWAEGTSVQDVR